MQPFDYLVPKDFAEASALLAQRQRCRAALHGRHRPADPHPRRLHRPERVVDLKACPACARSAPSPDGWLMIGAACTMNQVAAHPVVQAHTTCWPRRATRWPRISFRNRATVGGNCCNASPAADTAPALYCLDAVAEIYGPQRRPPRAHRRVLRRAWQDGPAARRIPDRHPSATAPAKAHAARSTSWAAQRSAIFRW